MSNEKPAQLHALLFQGHTGEGFYIGDRCKSFGCAVNSINPLTDAGAKVLGRVWMEPKPVPAPEFRGRHQDAIAAALSGVAPELDPGMVNRAAAALYNLGQNANPFERTMPEIQETMRLIARTVLKAAFDDRVGA